LPPLHQESRSDRDDNEHHRELYQFRAAFSQHRGKPHCAPYAEQEAGGEHDGEVG
jgi:hypothetical protein